MTNLITSILLILTIQPNLCADEPPCWCEFKSLSENGEYFAWIRPANKESDQRPWELEWTINVFKKSNGDSIKIWQSNYNFDGYTDGILSNNGQTFVYVNFWYYPDQSIVDIYTNGQLIRQINGEEFNIPGTKLRSTLSHTLWLDRNSTKYEFIEREGHQYIQINTIDEKTHLINCENK